MIIAKLTYKEFMKTLFVILISLFTLPVIHAQSIKTDSTNVANIDSTHADSGHIEKVVDKDSVMLRNIQGIYGLVNTLKPRYKMYQTEHTYILLKLDTATGRVWMVQYSVGDVDDMVVTVDDDSLLGYFDEITPGRFELYSTKNMYNFILLDTFKGYTYQVQWHPDTNKRFRIPLW